MTITVKSRVVRVRPRSDNTFGVTLGPGPNVFWFRTKNPPKLGEFVVVEGAIAERLRVPRSNATVTMLEGGSVRVQADQYQRRVVAPEWVDRVHRIVRRPLMPYQAEGAGWIASRLAEGKGSLLGDDPGMGKTCQVLAAIAATGCTPAIIVCPPSVKHNWKREAQYLKPKLKISVLRGGKGPIPGSHIVVINYAILRPRERQLAALRAKCIVFDEAHLLKEPKPGVRHRAAVATRLAKSIGRTIHMTGTPLLNRPDDLWRLLHIMDPEEWPSYQHFRKRYCSTLDDEEKLLKSKIVTNHGQAKRIDELRALTMPYIMRRQKMGNIPKKHRTTLMVELMPFDRQSYDAAEKDVVKWLRQVSSNERAMAAKRNQALVKLNMLRRIAAVGKLRAAVKGYLEAWFDKTKRPLVIFGYHKQVLFGVRDICRHMGLKISGIQGSDSDTKRQRSIDLFQGGYADVFIAPLLSAGVGLNLQTASDILALERLWTPSLMNQAESRCHRLGQMREVTVTYLDAVNTVDEHIAAVLGAKQILIDKVVDDKQPGKHQQMIQSLDDVIKRLMQGSR